MKGYLYSQDGSYAFPLGPKVTTVGRINCDISIDTAHVDNQHALIEYEDDQRCFILKDLNSSTGTYVHECRVQNAAVRIADGDLIRFGFHGVPFQFHLEQETTMPAIYPRQQNGSSIHLITQTIPTRRTASGVTNQQQQQIDVRQNPPFSLRTRPSSADFKKPNTQPTSNGLRDSVIRPNAWTITSTSNPGRSIINGSFTGEVDVSGQEDTELTNRVNQLEKEVKSRDAEIRELNNRLRSLEPMNSTFANEVHGLRTELDKVKREKQSASGFISSLQRDLHSKESSLAKLGREVDGIKVDSRDKDLRLQALQTKLNSLRDRNRSEEDRHNKEKELKIKQAEQQITELNESINRLKSQLQDTEKQLLKVTQNEQKLKQECEHTRNQLGEVQRSETALKSDLLSAQKKHNQLCDNIWRCFVDEEYDDEQHDIVEQIEQLQQQLDRSRNDFEEQQTTHSSSHEQLRILFEKLADNITNAMHDRTSDEILSQARQQFTDSEEDDPLTEIFKRTIVHTIDTQTRLLTELNSLLVEPQEHLPVNELLSSIRRQYDNLVLEKQNLAFEQVSREQTYRSELQQTSTEKDTFWQQRLDGESNRLAEQIAQLQREYDEQTVSFSDRLQTAAVQNSEYLQRWNVLQTESAQQIDELTTKLHQYEQELSEEREKQTQLTNLQEQQREAFDQVENEKNSTIEDLNGQMEVYKDQVRQFSLTIVQLEKNLSDEQEKSLQLQTDLDRLKEEGTSSAAAEIIVPVVPVLTSPVADLSQELFTYKSRVQEQEQLIISLRRDLTGMTARLSDLQGELSDKQKQLLEKSEATIREQSKELNETRLKLAKLSEIIDQQATQLQNLETDLSKSKILAEQYQLLVDQRQSDIDHLTKSLEQKNIIVQQAEKSNHDEGRITHELVSVGAQCKGERHELTISRQREALNELRARIKSLEQLRPVNPSYEKVLQQVVLLKRELAELRARQALPTDIPYLTTTPGSNSIPQQSTATLRQSPSTSEHSPETHQIIEERTAHAETNHSLQSYDELHNSFTRKLLQLLDIDDDSLVNVVPLTSLSTSDRSVALQQRQRTTEILIQKIEMLRERLSRKEDLLRDYEKDLGKLRQAEILIREKNHLLQDIETDKRSKDDEALFLQSTLRETQEHLNQEKRFNSSLKTGRNIDQSSSNEFIRRSGSTHPPASSESAAKARTQKRETNEKLARKDYEIKTLKQELNKALSTLSEQSHQVKLLQFQSKDTTNHS